MNAALLRKTLRDTAPLLIILALATMLFEVFFILAMREMWGELRQFLAARAIVRSLLGSLVGAELAGDITPTAVLTIGLAHPLVFAFTWTLLISVGTTLAAEMERGTADLLLTLPVSRAAVFGSSAAAAALCALVMSIAPLCGIAIGTAVFPMWEPVELWRLGLAAANLMALDLAIAALALLCASLTARRGIAIGIVLGMLLGSFLLNFLGQFWSVARRLRFLGLLEYYRPLPIAQSGRLPVGALLTLLAAAAFFATAGLLHFRRRDVPAA